MEIAMKRTIVLVGKDDVPSRFEKSANIAVARAIAEHHRNGRDTYGMRNGKIVVTKPDGRILDLDEDFKD